MTQKQTLALLAVLCLAATGCQKETIEDNQIQNIIENDNTACVMVYSVDGVGGRATLRNQTERSAFINKMVALAEEGHKVTFREDGRTINALANKETVTYSSKKKEEVVNWAAEMTALGYTVTVTYNEDTGYYTGTAVK